MAHLPYSIELHDSVISAIKEDFGDVILCFSHSYIHEGGNGYSQKLEIWIGSASVKYGKIELPVKVANGRLITNLGPYHNLLIFPVDTDGDVTMNIELFSDEVITIRGNGIQVNFLSEREFVETVSWEVNDVA
jgi:hypothetical protein